MAPSVARFVTERGVDPQRLNLCHMDGHMDLAYQRRILDMGASVSFDTFGLEIFFNSPDHNHSATDLARMEHLMELPRSARPPVGDGAQTTRPVTSPLSDRRPLHSVKGGRHKTLALPLPPTGPLRERSRR